MLPAEYGTLTKYKDNKLSLAKGAHYGTSTIQPQHLYFLSDDKIEKGDWFYYKLTNSIFQAIRDDAYPKDAKKIIATTDTSLGNKTIYYRADNSISREEFKPLPQPSQQFIKDYVEAYNRSNVGSNNFTITEVLVEYENKPLCNRRDADGYPIDENLIKVNTDNTINLKIS
jgi:hypothetical protein